jgi:hypothetical protein
MLRMLMWLFIWIILASTSVNGQSSSTYLISLSPDDCQHGLHPQPDGGPFAMFVFCDDALGVNIGLILTEPGAESGTLPLDETKTWIWLPNNRFWQDPAWATDVVNFMWSPSLRYVYVATSSIYGQGGVFELDLLSRTWERLVPSTANTYNVQLQNDYITRIEKLNLEDHLLSVNIYRADAAQTLIATETIVLK